MKLLPANMNQSFVSCKKNHHLGVSIRTSHIAARAVGSLLPVGQIPNGWAEDEVEVHGQRPDLFQPYGQCHSASDGHHWTLYEV